MELAIDDVSQLDDWHGKRAVQCRLDLVVWRVERVREVVVDFSGERELVLFVEVLERVRVVIAALLLRLLLLLLLRIRYLHRAQLLSRQEREQRVVHVARRPPLLKLVSHHVPEQRLRQLSRRLRRRHVRVRRLAKLGGEQLREDACRQRAAQYVARQPRSVARDLVADGGLRAERRQTHMGVRRATSRSESETDS